MTNEELQALLDTDRPDQSLNNGLPAAGPGAPSGMAAPGVQPMAYAPPAPPVPSPQPRPPMPQAAGPGLPVPQAQAPGLPAPAPVAPAKSVTDRESTTTTTRNQLDPGERRSYIEGQSALNRRQELAGEMGELNAEQARIRAEGDQRKAQLLQQHGTALKTIADDAANHMAEREAAYKAADEKWKQATPRDIWTYDDNGNRLTPEQTGKKKFWAGIALALSGLSARDNGGRNMAYEMIKDGIDRRDRLEQARIAKLKDVRDSARKDQEWILTQKHEAQADAATWKANALEQAAAEIEARAAKLNPGIERAKAEETAQKLRQDSNVTTQQYFQDAKTEIRNQVVTKTQQIVGAGAGGGTKVSGDDIQQISRLDADIKNIDGLIKTIGQNPVAWNDYKSNMEKWMRAESMRGGLLGTLRNGAQAAGLANIAPEQGLRTAAGKKVHMGMEAVKNSIAKGYGGVITEGDRSAAASELATLGATPTEQRETLKKLRDNLELKRQLYLQNKSVALPQQQPAPAAPARSEGGGEIKRVRNKKTGEEMMVRIGPDGRYYPVDQVAAR